MTKLKAKRSFWRGLLVLVVGIMMLVALTGCGGEQKADTPDSPQEQTQSQEQPQPQPQPQEEPQEPKNKPTISKAEFDQLKSGMSYEEVTAIIGGPGEVLSESGNPGDQYHTVMYQFEGEGQIGANANLLFQNNKLQNKSQFGLE